MLKTVHFKTNTLLKNLIGKDLINDDNIGIIELVKNSYDAYSEKINIIFDGFNEGKTDSVKSKIMISDFGVGMDESDIMDKWLNVAYSEKKHSGETSGVHYAGNKGVGRFSCDRLGSKLDMLTRKDNGELLHLCVDWEDFEKENDKDLTIQQIDISLESISDDRAKELTGIVQPKNGTILVISELRSTWRKPELLKLKRDLEKFINPNQAFSSKGFEINLIADYFKIEDEDEDYTKSVNGKVQNLIFDKLKFNTTYIESEISSDGKEIKTELFHDGEMVFSIVERNVQFPILRKIKVTLYFLNTYKKSYFKRQTGIRAIDFGSVFMFLNGFRVSPYGERGNDWLGMDVRKAQGHSRYFGTRDVIGRVEINDSEESFKPISSREGLKNTPEFSSLKNDFFINVLRRIERFVINGLDWDSVNLNAREEIDSTSGLDWEETAEVYAESWDKKKRRISTTIMTLIGVSKERVVKIWFNTKLMDTLVEQKSKEVASILDGIESFDGSVIDADLKSNLSKIRKVVEAKDEEIKTVVNELSDLKVDIEATKEEIKELNVDAKKNRETIANLEQQNVEFETETLFLKSVTNLDEKTLLGYHHQICLDSSIIDNYVSRAVKALRNKGDIKEALKYIEKISKANRKITATAQYATKAKFKSGTRKELTNLPIYFEQYILNVTKEFSASGLDIKISNNVKQQFQLKLKRIELSILIDNLVSNANKAQASSIHIKMDLISPDLLQISFIDDGKGIDSSIDVQRVFEMGVTTTQGSGLGLFHVKQIMDSLSSDIELLPLSPKGCEVKMVFSR